MPDENGKANRKPSATSAERMLVAERRLYVVRLKQSGASFRDIAAAINADPGWAGRLPDGGYDERRVYRDVKSELQRMRKEIAETVDDIRDNELLTLNRMQLALWQRALGTPPNMQTGAPAIPADLGAQQQIIRIMERRARYVPHLEVPARLQVDPLEALAGLLGVKKEELPQPRRNGDEDTTPAPDPTNGDVSNGGNGDAEHD
jgi:hypothetical protein